MAQAFGGFGIKVDRDADIPAAIEAALKAIDEDRMFALDAGLPAGVLNVVSSSASGISGPLLKDSRLRKVSFTGSTPVGKRLMADAAGNVLRTSMELGGNAPFIVFEDADLDKAVEGAMAAKMRNMGEACTAANRFLIHETVAADFTAKFAAAMGNLATGRGTEPAPRSVP
jgi:succinate-semialdehyde dehydrogenase/glutarate-semialdehyde dehydrogenase